MQDVIRILQLFPYLLLAWANRAKKTKGEIERREGRVGGGEKEGESSAALSSSPSTLGSLCSPIYFRAFPHCGAC